MKRIPILLALPALLLCAGCGGVGTTQFLHPEYDFGYVERVAVVPFENLSGDQGAGARAGRLFAAELLSAEAFDVVEPGEVARALGEINLVRTADLTMEQARRLGAELGAQGLFLGTVGESEARRGGGTGSHVVTITARLVETDTGVTIWSATHTEGGRGFWASLFGTDGPSAAETMRRCVRKCMNTLFD